MKFIAEIPSSDLLRSAPQSGIDGVLTAAAGTSGTESDRIAEGVPVFLRMPPGTDMPLAAGMQPMTGYAIDAPDGQSDLDRCSAELRVLEAKAARADGATPLFVFLFPDLASLANPQRDWHGSSRLAALAFDEARLLEELEAAKESRPAPLLHARALAVAIGRKLGRSVYVRPAWPEPDDDQTRVIAAAKADGFDGLIGPLALAPKIRMS